MVTKIHDEQNEIIDELEEESLIPEYIELTDEEQEWIDQLNQDNPIVSVIEKLVAHIEKQNEQLSKLALQLGSK
jgi:hypothetical protein